MDEKLLTPEEPMPAGTPPAEAPVPPQHEMYVRLKRDAEPELPHAMPAMPLPVTPVELKKPSPLPERAPGIPSQKQQQWGVVISIVIIVLMIIIGAFYAWGERIAENQAYPSPAAGGQ